MKFFTPYTNNHKTIYEPKCSKIVQDYILDESSGELVPSGTINQYERTQSYHESTKLSCKLARFGLGDALALGVPHDCNVDFSGVSADLREVLDSRKNIQNQFNAFPAELRQLFNNDFATFEEAVKSGNADRLVTEYIGKLADSNNGKVSEPTPTT